MMKFIKAMYRRFNNVKLLAELDRILETGKVPVVRLKADGSDVWTSVHVVHAVASVIKNGTDRIHGLTQDDLITPSAGLRTFDLANYAISTGGVVNGDDSDVRRRVLDAVRNVMYDEEVVVFRNHLGIEYCASRNPNNNESGITLYRRLPDQSRELLFMRWALITQYKGEWLPDGTEPRPNKHFIYYDWMEEAVRDRAHIPERKDSALVSKAKELLDIISTMDKEHEKLKYAANDLIKLHRG